MPCPKAIHHSSSSSTSYTVMQQGPKQACACDSPATRVNKPWVQKVLNKTDPMKKGEGLRDAGVGSRWGYRKIQKFFTKSLLFLILVSSFTPKYFSSISQTKCSYTMFQSFSFHSFSQVLVIHQSYIASVMNRVSISAEHRQFKLFQVPARNSLSHDICRT